MLGTSGLGRPNRRGRSGSEIPLMRAKRVAILKHTALVGIAVLCTPLAGCGSFESIFGSNPETALFHPEKKPAPEAGAQAAAGIRALPTDIDGAIKSAQDARKNGQFEAATKMLAQIMLVAPVVPGYSSVLIGWSLA